jgi:hypothetical protein
LTKAQVLKTFGWHHVAGKRLCARDSSEDFERSAICLKKAAELRYPEQQ